MSKTNFINEFVTRLNGKIQDDELTVIQTELTLFLNDWTVERQNTALVQYNGFPESYKVYMVTKKIEGRSDGTLNLYHIVLEDMFNTIHKDIQNITANDLRIYLYTLQQQRDISDRTLNDRRLIINGFFKWCMNENYITTNPCASIQPIKFEVKPRVPFTDVEMERLRLACKTLRERAMVEVLYATGCRCSELAGLKKDDIDLLTREVSLFGKGKKHRTSYLTARAEVALRNYYSSRDDDEPYVFVGIRKPHKRLHNSGIEKILRGIGDRAGVEHVFPHRVRHTFATDAINHGMPITDLQSLMGHERMDTTLIYGKISQSSMQFSHHRCVV